MSAIKQFYWRAAEDGNLENIFFKKYKLFPHIQLDAQY